MKTLLAAIASTLALGALAANVPWNGDGAYALGADDTMTFSSGATITAASTFTGNGTIVFSGASVTLNYKMDVVPFADFTGTVRIENNASVTWTASSFAENVSISPFGKAKIVFAGGNLTGFDKSNNQYFPYGVEVAEGTENNIVNHYSSSLHGVNLSWSGSLAGSGTLTIDSTDRWLHLSGDNSGFSGKMVFSGETGNENGTWFTSAQAGSASAEWVCTRVGRLYLQHAANSTIKLGALTVNGKTPSIDIVNAGTTVEIGGKPTVDSSINVPFVTNPFALNKVGADTKLTLGENVTFVSGSTLDVDEGILALDGIDLSFGVTLDFSAASAQSVTADGAKIPAGTAFGTLEIAAGGTLTVPAGSWTDGQTVTLFTYSALATGTTISKSNVNISGLSANAWAATTISDDGNGTVSATIGIPTLVWKGAAGATWETADAWTSGGNDYTFTANDKVAFTDGQSVALGSEVSVAGMTIADDATVTITGSNGAKITAASISNGGTLTIAGDVTLDAQITSNVCVEADSTLTFVSGQSIESLKFTGSGTVKFNTSDTMNFTYANLYANGVFAGFAGTLELTGGVKLNNTVNFNNADAVIFPSTKLLRLNKGTITEGATSVNITIHSDIEIVGGESPEDNTIFSKQANFNINGSVRGSGKAWFGTWQRGVRFYGDNRQFSGTMVLHSGDRYNSMGFNDQSCGSSNATWTVENDNYSKAETWGWYTLTFGYDNSVNNSAFNTEEKALHLGAFNVLKPNAILRTYSQPTWLVVGEKNEDCAIEGRFVDVGISDGVNRCNPLHLVKKGTETLTLGTNVVVMAGSTVRVDAGTLAVNSTNLNAAVAVESGATLAGTGTVASVTFAAGAKIAIDGLSATPEAGAIVGGIVVGGWGGTKPGIADAPVCKGGKWKVRTRSVAGGTQFYAEFVKSGFCIIVQ